MSSSRLTPTPKSSEWWHCSDPKSKHKLKVPRIGELTPWSTSAAQRLLAGSVWKAQGVLNCRKQTANRNAPGSNGLTRQRSQHPRACNTAAAAPRSRGEPTRTSNTSRLASRARPLQLSPIVAPRDSLAPALKNAQSVHCGEECYVPKPELWLIFLASVGIMGNMQRC